LPDQRASRLERRRPWSPRVSASAAALLVVAMASASAAAERFTESFDGRELSSRVEFSSSTAVLALHRREAGGGIDATGCERVMVRTRRLGTSVSWEQPIPAARVIDELTVSVSTWSRSRGLQLAVRVVFPHEVDPSTGRVLTDLVRGPRATRTGRWQRLTLDGLPGRLRERLVLLRARLKRPELEGRDAYIDRVVLRLEPDPGATEWLVDDLRAGVGDRPPRFVSTGSTSTTSRSCRGCWSTTASLWRCSRHPESTWCWCPTTGIAS